MMQRELVSIHCGQAGVQMGDACWKQLRLEHGIGLDGKPFEYDGVDTGRNCRSFFLEGDNHFTPRSILVDTEPSVIDEIKIKQSFASSSIVTGKEDAANNFARGYYTLSSELLNDTLELTRNVIERCDNFQGFLLFNSFGGGTGSGFTARLVEEFESNYQKNPRMEFCVFPSSRMSSAVVEPYNAAFRAHNSMISSQCMILFDNESCYNICRRNLDLERVQYSHINQLVAQLLCSVTGSYRFNHGQLNIDISEFQTNLVPFPNCHFLAPSYAPLLPVSQANINPSVEYLTDLCFRSEQQMFQYDPLNGKYFGCCLIYRGDVVIKEINNSIDLIRDLYLLKFPRWLATGFKFGIAGLPSEHSGIDIQQAGDIAPMKRSVCLLANNSKFSDRWFKLVQNFRQMYAKKAFIHWYISEGMEQGEFDEAIEDIEKLANQYHELGEDSHIP